MSAKTNSGRTSEWRRSMTARAECIAMCGALTAKIQIAEAEYKSIAPGHTFPAFTEAIDLIDKAMDLLTYIIATEAE